jgi:hypothetical protein
MKCAVGYDPTDIWGRVDCALNTLIGSIFNPKLLLAGLLGFFVCAFISGSFGLFIALIGFAIIFVLIFALLRATYVTITAYVALALMAIISPIFITCILFGTTRAYFEKWLKLTMSFILQPIFLFAYLAMMLAAFDTVIYDGKYSVYRAIVSPLDIGVYPAPLNAFPPIDPVKNPDGDFLIGDWLFSEGIYHKSEGPAMGVGTNPRRDPVLTDRPTGIGGSAGARELPDTEFNQKNVAGIGLNVLNNFESIGEPLLYPRIHGTASGNHTLTNNVLAEGQAHLNITNTSSSDVQTLKEGDVISVQNVYSVDPVTKINTGKLQQFVVRQDIKSVGGVYNYVKISPAIYITGSRQNVTVIPTSAYPTAGLSVYFIGFQYTSVDVYKVDLPIERISWQDLALQRLCNDPINDPACTAATKKEEICREHCYNLPTFPIGPLPATCDPTERSQCSADDEKAYEIKIYDIMIEYLIQLLLSLLIAFLTMYLFYLMLDMLPFIGAGMSEGLPAFGKGGMAMPGNKLIDNMKAGMQKLSGGGGK